MENWVNIIVSILSGLCVCIPLVYKLITTVSKCVREKNWNDLLNLVMKFMSEAETMFQTGEERKNYVLMAVKASASTINYDIDMDVVSEMIDNLCALSKKVNAPKEDVVEENVKAEG